MLIEPPMTLALGAFPTGRDSPVSSDSSVEEIPEITMASAGIISPGLTSISSPGHKSTAATDS
ncbi:MAG: hypothetical protein U1F34_03405 [Gammaproteobacteria bacterium]